MFSFLKKKRLLDKDDCERIVAAIRSVEASTTGEVRVYIESKCRYMDALERAKEIFSSLKMSLTEQHNAVLVYIALDDHQFAIYGDDKAYQQFGGATFWQQAAERLLHFLKQGKITEGIVSCIQEMGDLLKLHFPFDPTILKNELPDEIVFGK